MSAFVSATQVSILQSPRPLSKSSKSRSSGTYALRKSVRCMLTVERIANKSYQLEEDEDEVSTTSAVFLNEDGTLSIGKTDGPTPEEVNAKWKYSDSDGELMVEIERIYQEGKTIFPVKRILRGHLDDSNKNLRDLPVFTGAMYQDPADFSPHSEVGWFNMILATHDLPSDDFNISKQ